MKTLACIIIAVVGMTFSVSAQKATPTKTPAKEMQAPKPAATEIVRLKGTYTSKKGVMDHVSCFGYNVGYLQTDEKTRAAISFDRMANGGDIAVNCAGQLTVEGYYETVTKESNEACKGGSMDIFYVTKWACD